MRLALATLLAVLGATAASGALNQEDLESYSDPSAVIAAINANFETKPGQMVRVTVYENEEDFLEVAAMKHQGVMDESGVALIRLLGLEPGDYSFAAYLDENGDKKLNRGPLGTPAEPLAFSNGIRPRLRRPRFSETKVDVAPGSVVLITLED
ncbi:MAG: DUF2141 domain-containing protein [Pseudomonadota bacterium]